MKYTHTVVVVDDHKQWIDWRSNYINKTLGEDVVVSWSGSRLSNNSTKTDFSVVYIENMQKQIVGKVIHNAIVLTYLTEEQEMLLRRCMRDVV